MGEYKFFWCNEIRDLYNEIEGDEWYKYVAGGSTDEVLEELLMYQGIVEGHFDTREKFEDYMLSVADEYRTIYESFLEKVVGMYKEGENLGEVGNQETIFVCDEYYLVDCAMLEHLMGWIGFDDKNVIEK